MRVEASALGSADRGLDRLSSLRLTRRAANNGGQWLLATRENLSAYDAAYLQLAIELNAPLATFDRTLGQVAEWVLRERGWGAPVIDLVAEWTAHPVRPLLLPGENHARFNLPRGFPVQANRGIAIPCSSPD